MYNFKVSPESRRWEVLQRRREKGRFELRDDDKRDKKVR